MSDNLFFHFSATAELIINPVTDQISGANQEACRLLKQDIKSVLGLRASQVFASSFVSLVIFTQELIENGQGWCDHLYIQADNEMIRVEVTGRYSETADESYLHLTLQQAEQLEVLREHSEAQRHYLSGIEHWNRVAQVFQEFERQNQLLLDAAGEGIYGVDANGNTTFVNPAAERILGYQAQELAGRNMHSMVHHSHHDGSAFHVENCPIFAAFRDGTVHTVEDDVFWTKDGTAIDVEYTSTPVIDEQGIIGAVVIFRDVSEKKADRKRLLEAMAEVESLKNRLELENAYLQEEINSEFNHHQIIGNSAGVQKILQQIELVAPTNATTLICGESGTGKELIARAIHDNSQRSHRSLIRVNCAAIPADLFESEFFGHVKGAFTGATHDRPGRFELADGGTLFLDEVGEIPLHLQSKLLRVLQEQQFERVGEARTRHVDVRIIAATNQDLKQRVEAGLFREDLYFRLNVFPIESIPLRQRREDIPMLTQHFIKKACTRANKNLLKVSLADLDRLSHYHWPGNIRELENVIERQVILAQGDQLRFDGFIASTKPEMANTESPRSGLIATESALKQQQRQNILLALEQCQGKVFGHDGAAELLGMKPTTLTSRIKKYRIDPRRFKQHGEAL
jgi:PAS domain S-box-containing protein